MKLWTIQQIVVYEELQKTGVFRCVPEKIPEPSFADYYGWLIEHLKEKELPPEGVTLPVWAWYRFNQKEKKPDLRHSCYGSRGEKMVCLEIEIPDEKVLLSDFDLWHFVLNNHYLDNCFYPDYDDEDYEKTQKWFESISPEMQKIEKEKSWEQIFNIEPFENDWIIRGKYVQAIFWELTIDQIKKVQFFTAR